MPSYVTWLYPGMPGLCSHVLVNDNLSVPMPAAWQVEPVGMDGSSGDDAEPDGSDGAMSVESVYQVVLADVVDEADPRRHDSRKLARAIMRIHAA